MSKILRITQLNMPIEHSKAELDEKVRKILNLNKGNILDLKISSRAIDARKKPDVFYSYTIDISGNEAFLEKISKKISKSFKNKVSIVEKKEYVFPFRDKEITATTPAPIIIGSGPCGYFCGLYLARAGYKPIILEQGKSCAERKADIDTFWKSGSLNPDSNVQFGEGGAGTFSDGKLNTSIKDKTGRIQEVLKTFVEFGGKEDILYDSHPHLGTDSLLEIMPRFRAEIEDHGGKVLFNTRVDDLIIRDNRAVGVRTNRGEYYSDSIILACGHSSRALFYRLYEGGVKMEQKDFAVGFRVAHSQKSINLNQYGEKYYDKLPAAPYKLTYQSKSGRSVFSFCMCPGGYVVNASSDPKGCCVNGMSYSGRSSGYANSAIIISVSSRDFDDTHPLAGICFQEKLEKKAFDLAGGAIAYQLLGELRACYTDRIDRKLVDKSNIDFDHIFKGQIKEVNLENFLPRDMMEDFLDALDYYSRYIKGFNNDDTLVAAVESRTSSPVRILRDDTFQSEIKGLYPAGEGAGYAGGIVSAAIDGIRIAEAICGR